MKKALAGILAAGLVAAASVGTVTPAYAGTDKVTICHATGSGKYVMQEVAKDGTVSGHAGHQNAGDIIPAFDWIENKTRYYFDGQNLDKLDLLAKGCKADAVPGNVAPVAPTYEFATCLDPTAPHGRVTIPENLGEGIASTTPPVLNTQAGTWTVTYTLKPNDEDFTYAWPANQTGVYTFNVVHISEDELWVKDSKTGEGRCELSNTGAKMGNLEIAGGLIGLGLLAVAAASWNNRRKA